MLQLETVSPSHEELWIDRLQVRLSGSADDAVDGVRLSLVDDRDGNGVKNGTEPILRTVAATVDDGVVVFDDLGLVFQPGQTRDLLLLADVDVVSVQTVPQSTAMFPLLPLAPLLLLAAGRRPRRGHVVLLLLVALVVLPLGCGGGGGGTGCNGPFDPAGESVTLQLSIEPGDLLAFAPSTDPATPLQLPSDSVVSGVLEVSN